MSLFCLARVWIKTKLSAVEMLPSVEEDKSKFQPKCIIYTYTIQDKYMENCYLRYLAYPVP